jgi:hypothetical protein
MTCVMSIFDVDKIKKMHAERLRQLSEKEHRASHLHWGECRVSIGRNVFQYQSLVESTVVVFSLQPARTVIYR